MSSAKLSATELRRRIESHLQKQGCGLRSITDGFAIYDARDGAVIMTFADLRAWAQTNEISVEVDDRPSSR